MTCKCEICGSFVGANAKYLSDGRTSDPYDPPEPYPVCPKCHAKYRQEAKGDE